MRLVDEFGDAFDEMLEIGFIQHVGVDENGEPEYCTTQMATNYFEWQRKVEAGELLTPDDFENMYQWRDAIDAYKAKRDPNYKPKSGGSGSVAY